MAKGKVQSRSGHNYYEKDYIYSHMLSLVSVLNGTEWSRPITGKFPPKMGVDSDPIGDLVRPNGQSVFADRLLFST